MLHRVTASIVLLLALGATAKVDAQGEGDSVRLEAVRVGYHGDRTRVVFDLSAPATYKVFQLQRPQRVVIDLEVADPAGQLAMPSATKGVVGGIRRAVQPDGRYRFVFDLTGSAEASGFYLAPNEVHGHRVVVDLEPDSLQPPAGKPAQFAEEGDTPGAPESGEGAPLGPSSLAAATVVSTDSPVTESEAELAIEDTSYDTGADSLQGLFMASDADDPGPVAAEPYQVDGFAQFGAAYTVASPTHLSLARTLLELSADGRFSDQVTWKLSGRAAYDMAFELDNFYPGRVEDNREFDADFYENYLDIAAGDLEFRLGRQHIIWGEMVGLFFADVVSAKDMRQFVVQDFDLIRIPQWAARAEYYRDDYHAELIWIPVMTYNEIGKPGDDFYPLGGQLTEQPGVTIRNTEEPSNSLSNSAYGLRLSAIKRGWDLSGFYYRSVDAEPTFFSERVLEPEPGLVFTPRHKKIHQLGATLAKDFGQVVLKSEAIYTIDRYFVVEDVNDPDGVEQQDIVDYVIGLEHTTPANTLLNVQFYQRWYTDHRSANLLDEFETGASLFGKWEFSSTLDGELLLISQFNREDWMTRPRLTWHFATDWYLQFGADIFGGEQVGLFGRFDNSDRVYTNIRYTF